MQADKRTKGLYRESGMDFRRITPVWQSTRHVENDIVKLGVFHGDYVPLFSERKADGPEESVSRVAAGTWRTQH